MMAELSFYYCDTGVDQNEIFNGILRRISVLQNLLIGIIPDMAPSNNPPPPPGNPPPPPANDDDDYVIRWPRRGRRDLIRMQNAAQEVRQPRQADYRYPVLAAFDEERFQAQREARAAQRTVI